ncbi:MAG TPA: hypothetical protein P5525_11100 [Candidatus Paceibacterota bacterium]|nr:hypothetical protein [Candidatus Paceibacterota bacterium]
MSDADRSRYLALEFLRLLSAPEFRQFLVPERQLCDVVAAAVVPRPTQAELTETLQRLERDGHLAGAPATSLAPARWKITELGRLALLGV